MFSFTASPLQDLRIRKDSFPGNDAEKDFASSDMVRGGTRTDRLRPQMQGHRRERVVGPTPPCWAGWDWERRNEKGRRPAPYTVTVPEAFGAGVSMGPRLTCLLESRTISRRLSTARARLW